MKHITKQQTGSCKPLIKFKNYCFYLRLCTRSKRELFAQSVHGKARLEVRTTSNTSRETREEHVT